MAGPRRVVVAAQQEPALASIVWLGAGIAITMVLLARNRMGFLLHGLAIAAVAVLIGINAVGPSR